MKWDDRPLWYDVYAAHPPHREPVWDYKAPKHDQPVRAIFYKEDVVRASVSPFPPHLRLSPLRPTRCRRFYRTFGSPGAISMANERTKSLSQRSFEQLIVNAKNRSVNFRFLDQYEVERAEHPNDSEDALFERTTKVLIDQGLPLQQVKAREFVGMRQYILIFGIVSQSISFLG